MRRIGEKEEWRDNRYAELEAEIEVSTEGRRRSFLRQFRANGDRIRRLPSLSLALQGVSGRLVLVEGDPGSGKSVALRHLTQSLALRLVRKPSERDPIPLYVNLKDFRAEPINSSVTAADVREIILRTLNRGRNRDIDRYLDEEFDRGLEDGTWLFLFDSFDEIPAVLSATEADQVIENYSDAIYDFMHGMGTCRGIIASREFRGPPRRYNWPRFKIVPLSWSRKCELIEKADLSHDVEAALKADLENAPSQLLALSDNPMFLGLLCEHVREGHSFPESAHVVIESFVHERLARDAERIQDIFAVEPEVVREVAEELAFHMSYDESIGLAANRSIAESLLITPTRTYEEVKACLNALEYTKLARSETTESEAAPNTITFSHRRIQEYFATCVVLREPRRINAWTLLTDGRWRETAVTLFQAQEGPIIGDLLQSAERALRVGDSVGSSSHPSTFKWLPGQLHVLQVLAEGGGYAKYHSVATGISTQIDNLLTAAWDTDNRRNRKWVLEACASATPAAALKFIREAFEGDSPWLREEAYKQARRVRQISQEIEREVRQSLIDFSVGGELRRNRGSIRAQVSRISNPLSLLQSIKILLAAPYVDTALGLAIATFVGFTSSFGVALSVALMWVFTGFAVRTLYARPRSKGPRWIRTTFSFLGSPVPPPRSPGRMSFKRRAKNAFTWGMMPTINVILLSRIAYTIVPVIYIPQHGFQEPTTYHVGYFALSLPLTFWLVSALAAVREGQSLQVAHWPILPLLSIARLGRRLWRALRKLSFGDVGIIVVGSLIGLAFIGSFIAALAWLAITREEIFNQISIALAVVGFGYWAYAAARRAVLIRQDRKVAELPSEMPSQIELSWIVKRLCTLRSSDGVVLLLRNLRTVQPLPSWSEDALSFVARLAEFGEIYRQDGTVEKSNYDAFWQEAEVDNAPLIERYARPEVLDEMARIESELAAATTNA